MLEGMTHQEALFLRKKVKKELNDAMTGIIKNHSSKKWEMLYVLQRKFTELLKKHREDKIDSA